MSDEEKIKKLMAFVKDIATNYDCDDGEKGLHSCFCRKCEAKELLKELGEPIDDA